MFAASRQMKILYVYYLWFVYGKIPLEVPNKVAFIVLD